MQQTHQNEGWQQDQREMHQQFQDGNNQSSGLDYEQQQQKNQSTITSQNNGFYVRSADQDQQKKRMSLMSTTDPNKPNFLNMMKSKLINRLNETRKSIVQNRRTELMNQITQSKMKQGYVERQVQQEMMESNLVGQLMADEIKEWTDEEINNYLDEFAEIERELNLELAQELYMSTMYDEEYHYNKYEQQNQEEIEILAQTFSTNNNDLYNCAICKNHVFRVNRTLIRCEKPNCVDLELGNENFCIETVMNLIMKEVLEHREVVQQDEIQHQQQQQQQLYQQNQNQYQQMMGASRCGDLNLQVKLQNLNELFEDCMNDEVQENISMGQTSQEDKEKQRQMIQGQAQGDPRVNLGLIVSCDTCTYTGIIQLYD